MKITNNIFYLAIGIIIALSFWYGHGDRDAQFKAKVTEAIDRGNNQEINQQLKREFNEEYGWERAQKEAKEYCEALKQGKTREEIFATKFRYRERDRSGQETTIKKGAYLKFIKIIIYHAAENSYCPQGRFF